MFQKKDTLLLQSAYMCSVSRYNQRHLSPIEYGQTCTDLSKVRLPSQSTLRKQFLTNQSLPENLDRLIKSLQWINYLPWINGSIDLLLHPQLSLCINLATQYGLTHQQISWGVDQVTAHNFVCQFQDCQHTHHFNQLKEQWDQHYKFNEQELKDALKAIQKESNGFAFYEFISVMDSCKINSPQLSAFIEDVRKGFIDNIDGTQLLAIFLKKEPIINRQMRLRFIILIKRDFLDSPAQLTDLSFFEKIKLSVEQTQDYQIFYDPSLLNGYMQSNLFHKKTQPFKEQIRQLKIYLVGTDTLYRIGCVESTFSVLYTKVKIL